MKTIAESRMSARPTLMSRLPSLTSPRAVLSCLLLLLTHTAAADASLDQTLKLDIPANSKLEDALIEWGSKAGVTVMINTATVAHHMTRGVRGTSTARHALSLILQGSGLSYSEENGRIRIVPAASLVPSGLYSPSRDAGAPSGLDVSSDAGADSQEASRQNSNVRNDLSEVIVTAQKRSERLQDVPVPVTAVGADALLEQSQYRLEDYYSDVPGINLAPGPSGTSSVLTIRGLSSGTSNFGNPTTSVTVDDVPVGATASYGGGNNSLVPDIDPSDLARVEVLRGPQGTLYGSSSLGGLIKYVTVDPSTTQVSGRVQADLDGVYHGDQVGYGIRASANVPLTDDAAFRISAFSREDPGYIDNVLTGKSGVNRVDVYGGRFSFLWRANDAISIKLGALLQDTSGFGSQNVDSNLGNLQQSYIAGTGGFHQQVGVYNLTVSANLGPIDLIAVSGYNHLTYADIQDWTPFLGFLTEAFYQAPGTWDTDNNTLHKFSEEIRLSSHPGSTVDWLVGGFFTREASHYEQKWLGIDPNTSQVGGTLLDGVWPTTYTEYAGFADVTWHVTPSFDLQVGGRESENKQTYSEVDGGDYAPFLLNLPAPFVTPEVETKDNAFTYLFTPSWKVSKDFLVYARLASGYRAGGPNPNCTAYQVPCHFSPDKTKNYEIGAKGDLADHKVSLDASLYYIAWKDIQLAVLPPGTPAGFFSNAGGAKSEGAELSVQFKPGAGFSASGWVSWNEAVLTQGFPSDSSAYGVSGNRLPNSSRFSANAALHEETLLGGSWIGFAGISVSYVGDRLGNFQGLASGVPLPRQDLPGFARTDLQLGTRYNSWSITMFANNITDRRGVLGGGLDNSVDPNAFFYIQPRTIGMSLTKTF